MRAACRRLCAISGIENGGTIQGAGDGCLAFVVEGDGRCGHRHVAELFGGHFGDLAGAGHGHGHGLEGRVGRMPLDAEARALGEQRTIGGRRFGTVGGIADVIGLVEAGRHFVGDEGHCVAININYRSTWGGALVAVGEGVRSHGAIRSVCHSNGSHQNAGSGSIQINGKRSRIYGGIRKRVERIGVVIGGIIHRCAIGSVI